jgi:glycosyltransferase involved in cell wall biosynthesis
VFGLNRRTPVLGLLPLLRHHSLREAVSLVFRLRTAAEIADYVSLGGFIFAHFAWTTADIAAAASQLSGRPWYCFVHAWDVFTRPAAELRRRMATATRVVACSQAAADACATAGIDRKRISIIHHAVSVESRNPKPENSHPLAAIAVGRLVEKKGFDTLVRAWPAVLRDVPGATLRIVGDGPCAASLRRLAREVCGRNDVIDFSGALPEEETLRAIASADMLVLPSRRLSDGDRDGIANVILEAMALGVPVVTTDAGAAGEVIEDGVSGLLLPHPAAPDSLSAAVVRLAEDENLRTAIADNARAVIREKFSSDAYISAIEELLDCANMS